MIEKQMSLTLIRRTVPKAKLAFLWKIREFQLVIVDVGHSNSETSTNEIILFFIIVAFFISTLRWL